MVIRFGGRNAPAKFGLNFVRTNTLIRQRDERGSPFSSLLGKMCIRQAIRNVQGTAITGRPPHIYGPAARCKRINWMGHAVRFNLSDLWLEHALRAIMEIRAQLSSLDPRPRGPCAGPDFSCAGETVVPSFSLSLANLGREAPDLLLARSHSHHAAFGVGAASYPRA